MGKTFLEAPLNRREAIQRLAATSALGALPIETLVSLSREARANTLPPIRVLGERQASGLRAAAEAILPRTDTPGATDAQVTEFIDWMMAEWMHENERSAMLAAIDDLDRRAQATHGTSFSAATAEQQNGILAVMDAEVAELLTRDSAGPGDEYVESPDSQPTPTAPAHPFYQIKRWTLVGYFTSEPGMTEALKWNPFPGRWEPCMNIEERT